METYFSVSLNGRFVFRTDVFLSASAYELARVETALRLLSVAAGYKVTRSDRPAGWESKEVA